MDQGRGLERMVRWFLGHLGGGQLSQLVVHKGQELLGSNMVTLVDGGEDAGDFGHCLSFEGTSLQTIMGRRG